MFVFFFKQKTAYEMRISDWSSDVCSSDLAHRHRRHPIGDDEGNRHPVRLPRDRPLRDHPAQPHMLAERQPVALHVARRVEERRLTLERRERDPARAQYRDQPDHTKHTPPVLGLLDRLYPHARSAPSTALPPATPPPCRATHPSATIPPSRTCWPSGSPSRFTSPGA